MDKLHYALISEGSSDQVLLPIINWLLLENGLNRDLRGVWIDFGQLVSLPQNIQERIEKVLDDEDYRWDLLFIHRDADNVGYRTRKQEILQHLSNISSKPPAICVVPVRMQETWLLINENAIREAAQNRNGKTPLDLPPLKDLENHADPKAKLHKLLLEASELTGRKRKKFNVRVAKHRIPQFIKDFSPLRNLSAFAALETDIQTIIDEQGWND